MKILVLYACLGGNRYLWGDEHEITAVELDPELARMYKERFKNDTVIVADAHQYLIDHYREFDFVWSSPPCPTHSRIQTSLKERPTFKPYYPDMKLYEEVIFLGQFFKGKYCVENVIPYYDLLIPGHKRGRHIYWTNFKLPSVLSNRSGNIGGNEEVKRLCEFHKIDLTSYKGDQRKDKIARNLVDYEAGRTILDTAMGIIRQQNDNQISMFNDLP